MSTGTPEVLPSLTSARSDQNPSAAVERVDMKNDLFRVNAGYATKEPPHRRSTRPGSDGGGNRYNACQV